MKKNKTRTTDHSPNDILSVRAFARLAGVSHVTIIYHIARGHLTPVYKKTATLRLSDLPAFKARLARNRATLNGRDPDAPKLSPATDTEPRIRAQLSRRSKISDHQIETQNENPVPQTQLTHPRPLATT